MRRTRPVRTAAESSECGDTLIEVLVGALLLALIAAGVFTGFIGVGTIAATQRNVGQANVLAQQDQARMHSLTAAQLSGGAGNTTATTTLNGTTYTVVSTATFVAGGNGASACTAGGSTSADEIATASSVTWGANNGGHPPVVVSGLITPAVGGSLILSAIDQAGSPLSGVVMTVAGPTTVSPLVTDAAGCAVFGGLSGGDYSITATAAGRVEVGGSPSITQTVTVIPAQTAKPTTQFQFGQPGAITVNFVSTYNGASQPSSSDSFMVSNTGMSAARVFTTTGGFASPLSSTSTLYPFTTPYSVYAGSCTADAPPAANQGSASAGGAATVQLPALVISTWISAASPPLNDSGSGLAYTGTGWTRQTGISGAYQGDETASATANNSVSTPFTGTTVQWIGSLANNHGYANVYVDNVLVSSNVDAYGNQTSYQQVIWSRSGLAAGSHTLKIVVTGGKRSSAKGASVPIDEIIASGGTALMTTSPHITLTDTGCASRKTVPATVAPSPTTGALADPGVPYANLTVCADNGVVRNSAVITQSSLSFVTATAVSLNLYAGASGVTTGVCP